jgi:hypothetical protein
VSKSLDEAKRSITEKYLGKQGIHGVGISRSKNALRVYVDAASALDDQHKAILEKIKQDAAPYSVLEVEEERATITW